MHSFITSYFNISLQVSVVPCLGLQAPSHLTAVFLHCFVSVHLYCIQVKLHQAFSGIKFKSVHWEVIHKGTHYDCMLYCVSQYVVSGGHLLSVAKSLHKVFVQWKFSNQTPENRDASLNTTFSSQCRVYASKPLKWRLLINQNAVNNCVYVWIIGIPLYMYITLIHLTMQHTTIV